MEQTAKRLHTAQDQEIVDTEHSQGAMTHKTLHCLLSILRILGKLRRGPSVCSELRRQVGKGTSSSSILRVNPDSDLWRSLWPRGHQSPTETPDLGHPG